VEGKERLAGAYAPTVPNGMKTRNRAVLRVVVTSAGFASQLWSKWDFFDSSKLALAVENVPAAQRLYRFFYAIRKKHLRGGVHPIQRPIVPPVQSRRFTREWFAQLSIRRFPAHRSLPPRRGRPPVAARRLVSLTGRVYIDRLQSCLASFRLAPVLPIIGATQQHVHAGER
jgi:hypothetical protein